MNFKLLLFLALATTNLVQHGVVGWFRFKRLVKLAICCYFAGCFSKQQVGELCDGLDKSMVKRQDWHATEARQVHPMTGMISDVMVWHTGPETCQLLGLSGSNCGRCIEDERCLVKHIASIQAADLGDGMDDIRFNFLIGQDGAIYEGRGWQVAGQDDDGHDVTSLSVAMIGDFTKVEPSQASQNAFKNLVTCGQANMRVLKDLELIVQPDMSGQAFFNMIERCNGFC